MTTTSRSLPLISIVMPIYNGEKYIQDAIDSVLSQSYPDFELLICDAGSTDATLQIIDTIDDPRIKVVSRQDKNLPDGINKGFLKAGGEIYAWLNCDDMYLHPGVLDNVASRFRNSHLDYVVGLCGMVSEDGNLFRLLLPWIVSPPYTFKGHSNIFTGALFFSCSVWKEFGGFSVQNNLAFEYEFLKFLMHGSKKCEIESQMALAGFRIRPDSLSGANAENMRQQLSEILGEPFVYPINFSNQLVRLYSYITSGQFFSLLNVKKLNRQLPVSWRYNLSRK